MDLTFSFKLFGKTSDLDQGQWIQFAIITAVILSSIVIAYWGSPVVRP
jgi:hypothetical protein